MDGRSLVLPDDGRRHGRCRREEEVQAGRQRGGQFERGRMYDVISVDEMLKMDLIHLMLTFVMKLDEQRKAPR